MTYLLTIDATLKNKQMGVYYTPVPIVSGMKFSVGSDCANGECRLCVFAFTCPVSPFFLVGARNQVDRALDLKISQSRVKFPVLVMYKSVRQTSYSTLP